MFDVSSFTPISATIGGVIIGLSAALLWAGSGRITGISGHLHGLIQNNTNDRTREVLFVVGIVLGAATVAAFGRTSFPGAMASRKPYLS